MCSIISNKSVTYIFEFFLHFCDFPTFTNSINLQIINKRLCFLSWFHPPLKVLECRCCTQAEKVLSSPRLQLMGQGTALQCYEPSVIPLSHPGSTRSSTYLKTQNWRDHDCPMIMKPCRIILSQWHLSA